MTTSNALQQKSFLACMSVMLILVASFSHNVKAANEACFYPYVNAGLQNIKSEKKCIPKGGHGSKSMGGSDKNFAKLGKVFPAFTRPAQYVTLKDGYSALLYYKDANGKWSKKTQNSSGEIDIRRGHLKGVRIYKTSKGKGANKVCMFESKSSFKKLKRKHALCFREGSYPNLDAYGWNDKAKYMQVVKGYKVTLYKDKNFKGHSSIMEKSGRIRMEGKNKSVTSIRISKK